MFTLTIVLKFAEFNKSKKHSFFFFVPAAVQPERVKDTVEILTMWHSGMKRSPRGQGEGSPLCGSKTLPEGKQGGYVINKVQLIWHATAS